LSLLHLKKTCPVLITLP